MGIAFPKPKDVYTSMAKREFSKITAYIQRPRNVTLRLDCFLIKISIIFKTFIKHFFVCCIKFMFPSVIS